MTSYWRWAACMVALACLTACQARRPETAATPLQPRAPQAPAAIDAAPVGVDWTKTGDCQGMLDLLQHALDDGRITDLGDT